MSSTLLLFMIAAQVCYCWYITDMPFPYPTGFAQMAFNNTTSTVYLFGGRTLNVSEIVVSAKIYKHNISNHSAQWIELNIKLPGNFSYSQIQNSVTIDDLVYFIGINDNYYSSNQIFLFNMTTEEFTIDHMIPKSKYPACSGCLVTNNTHIFMIGGIIGSTLIKHMQILNIKSNNWTYHIIDLSFISEGWSHQSCSMVNNIIYTFGGVINSTDWGSTNVIYKYNVLSSQWYHIGNLSHWTSQGWTVYSDKYNKIYIVTIDEGLSNVTLSVFDIKVEKIVFKNELRIPVFATPMLLYEDVIMIFGGFGYYIYEYGASPYIFTQFVQMERLPLMPYSSSSSKHSISMNTGLFVGIISMNSIFCIVLGCIIGYFSYKYTMRNRNVSGELDVNNIQEGSQYGALNEDDEELTPKGHRVM